MLQVKRERPQSASDANHKRQRTNNDSAVPLPPPPSMSGPPGLSFQPQTAQNDTQGAPIDPRQRNRSPQVQQQAAQQSTTLQQQHQQHVTQPAQQPSQNTLAQAFNGLAQYQQQPQQQQQQVCFTVHAASEAIRSSHHADIMYGSLHQILNSKAL